MVNQRSIRDGYKTIATKKAAEEKASGVSPEHTELDDVIEEIEDLFNESDSEYEEEKNRRGQRKRCN